MAEHVVIRQRRAYLYLAKINVKMKMDHQQWIQGSSRSALVISKQQKPRGEDTFCEVFPTQSPYFGSTCSQNFLMVRVSKVRFTVAVSETRSRVIEHDVRPILSTNQS